MKKYVTPKKEEIIEILSKYSSYKIYKNKVIVDDKIFNKYVYNYLNEKNPFLILVSLEEQYIVLLLL